MPEPNDPASSPPELKERAATGAARMSFGDHLEELRTSVVRALIGIAIAAGVALFFGTSILQLLFLPLWRVQIANDLQPNVQALAPTDAFSAYLKMSLMGGLIVSMPWVMLQVWSFVHSGLYPHERRFVKRLTLASSGLFVAGVLFLYFLVLPVALQFFISFNRAFEPIGFVPAPAVQPATPENSDSHAPREADGASPNGRAAAGGGALGDSATAVRVPLVPSDPPKPAEGQVWVNTQTCRLVLWWQGRPWSMGLTPGPVAPAVESQFSVPAYISFVLLLALAFGIAFETPIVVLFLAWSNLVPADTFSRHRRHVILAIVFASAVLTPTTDLLNQALLAVPMYVLFEIGLWAARAMERKREAAGA